MARLSSAPFFAFGPDLVYHRQAMIEPPYLLFLGDAEDPLAAKTASGIAVWRPEICLGQSSLPGCRADLGLPEMTPAEAASAGARTMVVGVANRGGTLGEHWIPTLLAALEAGLDLANGLHQRLTDRAELRAAAHRLGRRLIDIRHPGRRYPIATAVPRSGRRLLTVGTDCSVGKMFTSLAIAAELQRRGRDATFRATGQTGILIAGDGVPVDAVIADFIAGSIEQLCPAADPAHWDVIEGQGSILHPSYAGVSLGLLHGAQPQALVLCHEPTRRHLRGLPHFPVPALDATIAQTLAAGRLTSPHVRFVGVSLNTADLPEHAAADALEETHRLTGLPVADPMRGGVGPLVDALLEEFP
jgi:uncharacterized NAD-dependent epimerase/dehydratase family protein